MTKQEAKLAMYDGYKVRHRYFNDDEFIYEKDGFLYDEQKMELDILFWEHRKSKDWDDGWEIFKKNSIEF